MLGSSLFLLLSLHGVLQSSLRQVAQFIFLYLRQDFGRQGREASPRSAGQAPSCCRGISLLSKLHSTGHPAVLCCTSEQCPPWCGCFSVGPKLSFMMGSCKEVSFSSVCSCREKSTFPLWPYPLVSPVTLHLLPSLQVMFVNALLCKEGSKVAECAGEGRWDCWEAGECSQPAKGIEVMWQLDER